MAFGPDDWSQGNAIEILCRLAAKGLAHDDTVRALEAAAPTCREDALLYALAPLKRRAASDGELQKVIEELRMQPEFQEAYDGLPAL